MMNLVHWRSANYKWFLYINKEGEKLFIKKEQEHNIMRERDKEQEDDNTGEDKTCHHASLRLDELP